MLLFHFLALGKWQQSVTRDDNMESKQLESSLTDVSKLSEEYIYIEVFKQKNSKLTPYLHSDSLELHRDFISLGGIIRPASNVRPAKSFGLVEPSNRLVYSKFSKYRNYFILTNVYEVNHSHNINFEGRARDVHYWTDRTHTGTWQDWQIWFSSYALGLYDGDVEDSQFFHGEKKKLKKLALLNKTTYEGQKDTQTSNKRPT